MESKVIPMKQEPQGQQLLQAQLIQDSQYHQYEFEDSDDTVMVGCVVVMERKEFERLDFAAAVPMVLVGKSAAKQHVPPFIIVGRDTDVRTMSRALFEGLWNGYSNRGKEAPAGGNEDGKGKSNEKGE